MRVRGVETTARVFFEIAIDDAPAGRMEFNLFGGMGGASRTAENFRALCTGEKGLGSSGVPLHYKGVPFHRIVTSFMCQASQPKP